MKPKVYGQPKSSRDLFQGLKAWVLVRILQLGDLLLAHTGALAELRLGQLRVMTGPAEIERCRKAWPHVDRRELLTPRRRDVRDWPWRNPAPD